MQIYQFEEISASLPIQQLQALTHNYSYPKPSCLITEFGLALFNDSRLLQQRLASLTFPEAQKRYAIFNPPHYRIPQQITELKTYLRVCMTRRNPMYGMDRQNTLNPGGYLP